MSKLHVATLVTLAALSLPASPALAQVIFGRSGVSDRAIQGRVTEGDVYTCSAAPGGSRIRENCDVVPEIERLQREQLERAMKQIGPAPLAQCGASTTTESRQIDAIARVSATLEIRDCAAAAGTLTVAVVVKDKSGGGEKPLEFTETWQRSDDRDVAVANDYPIGENVELVDVHLSGLTCTCADPFAPAPPPAAKDAAQ
jgi:hypothetical protein